ncbi:MAG: hypothetical protein QOK37_2189 [Thermoanaerobaculia bacterium]|jgi:hypothetical protein|nr:hypothetical protein [Thermoanaerobaculia bacterium]
MKRIALVAVIISFVSFGAFSASKPVKKTAAKPQAAALAATAPVPLAALFPAPNDTQSVTDAKGMVTIDAPNHEVIMVRIESDGTRTHACVNTETKARAFLSNAKATPSAVAPQGK